MPGKVSVFGSFLLAERFFVYDKFHFVAVGIRPEVYKFAFMSGVVPMWE